jgi:hypothetical protein
MIKSQVSINWKITTTTSPPGGGGQILADVIWGKNMKGEEKKVDKFKEKGRKWKEKGKGKNKEKMESKRVKKCEIKN